MPQHLPVPSWAERRDSASSLAVREGFLDPGPSRPVTAPSHISQPRRSSSQLPSWSALDQPDQSRLTLPAFRDGRASISSITSSSHHETHRVSWSTTSSRPSFEAITTPRPTSSPWIDRSSDARRPSMAGSLYSPFSERHPSSDSSYFPTTPEPPRSPLSRTSNHSRVLVGSLTSVCQRLLGPDGTMGLFFFAHDLGVRTEGTFTLKFTLTNLTS